MGRLLQELSEKEAAFIRRQPVIFVATAAATGRVNVSPRSPGRSLAVLSPRRCALLDLTGSGSETAAHLTHDGRITVMCVNLEEGPPQILRIHGRGRVLLKAAVPADTLAHFPPELREGPGFRAVYMIDVERVTASCGFSMPIMELRSYRATLDAFAAKSGAEGMRAYRQLKNGFSVDGLRSVGALEGGALVPLKRGEAGYQGGYLLARPARTWWGRAGWEWPTEWAWGGVAWFAAGAVACEVAHRMVRRG